MELAEELGADGMEAIRRAGAARFHCVGDTGGLHDPLPQREVAAAMATELAADPPVSFFYHLGDIVYLYGEEANYDAQFLRPYSGYGAPILAIPGNHDGDRAPGSEQHALEPFVRHFCSPKGSSPPQDRTMRLRAQQRVGRQPNVYWTLTHDWVTIIGLYTNVPDGGLIDEAQLRWLADELSAAPAGVTLILAMHHPVLSADTEHGSNLALRDVLDDCFGRAGRTPDAVFSAHAHNYQRFSRAQDGREIPYVVAGGGGFRELHGLGFGVPDTPASFAGLPGVKLECYQDTAFGFMTVAAGPAGAEVCYQTVTHHRKVTFDSFRITPA